jgi:phage gp29-like protein
MWPFDQMTAPFRSSGAAPAAPAERTEPALSTPGNEQGTPTISSFARNPYGSHPAAGLTPIALALILRGSIDGDPRLYLELAEDMEERFAQYGATLSTRKRQVASLEFSVVPAGDEQADLDEAELVRQVVTSAAFKGARIDILDAIGKGFSAVEVIWDTSEKPWVPAAFKHRDQRFFVFDRVDPDKILLRTESGTEELWDRSWIVHRAKSKSGLAIRGGLARQAAWLFLFQSFNIRDWAIFAEAYGQPMRLGKFDPGASNDDKKVLLEAVHAIGTDFAAIIPAAMTIELVKAELSSSTDLYERRGDWLDRQCSKVVLGQTGTTDGIEGGGYAQGKVHDGVRADIEEADAEQLAATLNNQLVPSLIEFNFAPRKRKGFPEIKIGRPDEEDVDKLIEHIVRLVPMGLSVDMAEIQQKIGITAPAKGAILLAPRRTPPTALPGNDNQLNEKRHAASQQLAAGDAVDQAVFDMMVAGCR